VVASFGTFAAGLYFYVYKNQDLRDIAGSIGSRFKASVTISADDNTNQHVLSHLKCRGLVREARCLTLVNKIGSNITHCA
jgi:hypothetical protein